MAFIDKDTYISNILQQKNTRIIAVKKDAEILFDGRVIHIPKSIPNAGFIFNSLMNIDEWFSKKSKKNSNYPIENFTFAGKMIIKMLEDFFYMYNITIFVHKIFGNYYPTGKSNTLYSNHKYNEIDVISLSFGESRSFTFKNYNQTIVKSINLSHGDILIFDKVMNNNYTYGILKDSLVKNINFNIICFVTFFTL